MTNEPRVGPFLLGEVLGRGGMGVVHRARHAEQGTPAAVKFDLHPPDDASDEAFLNEVRLMAGLDHPNCIVVYDTSRVLESEVDWLDPEIRIGSSWLAMELAAGGSVKENKPTDWPGVRHVVTSLLEALAHAHSRGVVHRDVKAPNLLLRPVPGSAATDLSRFQVVLSDFGIGHHTYSQPTWMDQESVGTPTCMAPEQIEARWRDTGPWTDLYQVGILVWRLATGANPFKGRRPLDFYRAHMFSSLPAFEPVFPVPPGLDAWTRRLLEKDWRARPDSAALALHELQELPEPEDIAPARSAPTLPPSLDDTMATQVTASRGRGDSSVRGAVLSGAGLGLWGLRTLPLIGRTRESHALSHTLGLVELHGKPRWTAVAGPAGVGKTRLVEWLAESSHESGRARYWRATHSVDRDPDRDGVRGMLRRELRLAGLEPEELSERLALFIDNEDTRVVVERWCGDGEGVLPSQRARAGAFAELLRDRSGDRPLVVVIEDAHHAEETLRLVRFILSSAELPILFVGTVRDDLIALRPAEKALVEELAKVRDSRLVRLGALADVAHQELVRRLLGLDPELAVDVEQRTGGNPQFAVQLVNDWVQRGVLVPGPEGLRIRRGASTEVPDTLAGMWRGRLRELLPTLSESQAEAMEIAAVFGLVVESELWEQTCTQAGADASGLVASLTRRGLAFSVTTSVEWSFGHELFRQAVLERSRESGRHVRWASLAADTLLDGKRSSLQVAGLLTQAHRHAEAFEPLRVAVNLLLESGDMRTTARLEELHDILTVIGAEAHDPRWCLVLLLRAWYCRMTGDTDIAEVLAHKAKKLADESGDPSARGWAHREAGILASRTGDFETALADFEHASTLLAEAGRSESASQCLVRIADIFTSQGLLDDAEVLYTHVLEDFEREIAWVFSYEPHFGLARIATERGELERALDHLAEARRCVQRAGQRGERIRIENYEGDVRRKAGQMEEAAERYGEVVAAAMALKLTSEELYGRLNTVILYTTMRDFERATEAIGPLLRVDSGKDPMLEGFTNLVNLPLLAKSDQLAALEKALSRGEKFTEETGIREADVAMMCTVAAEHASGELSRRLEALADLHTIQPVNQT